MTEQEFGELKAMVAQTRDDVRRILDSVDGWRREVSIMKGSIAKLDAKGQQHQLLFKIIGAVLFVLLGGAGGWASLTSVLR